MLILSLECDDLIFTFPFSEKANVFFHFLAYFKTFSKYI